MRRGINDGARDKRANEGGGFADDGEEREEEEFLAARCHLGDHDLAIRVPRADEKTVKGLIQPKLPHVVEAEPLRPYANHPPPITCRSRRDQQLTREPPIRLGDLLTVR